MRRSSFASLFVALAVAASLPALAQSAAANAASRSCPRYAAGSSLVEAKNIFSSDGVLGVSFTYTTRVDGDGNTSYCFMTSDGVQSPTLHVKAGDKLLIRLKNALPATMLPAAMSAEMQAPAMPEIPWVPDVAISGASVNCAAKKTAAAKILGADGDGTVCASSPMVKTLVGEGDAFLYSIQIPANAQPGMYWYYPHIRGIADPAVQGGASGALIVDGIENVHHEVAGLPVRTLIIRDTVSASGKDAQSEGFDQELSLNYAPMGEAGSTPVVIPMKPDQKQLWMVLNASAETTLDLVVQYDGTAQPLLVVGTDGSSAAKRTETGTLVSHILLAPSSRAQFVVTGPGAEVKDAKLLTVSPASESEGRTEPRFAVAKIWASSTAEEPLLAVPRASVVLPKQTVEVGLNKLGQ
jgi:FtsP/CotA-like multicopper oxidase with cupredoxin domain